MEKLHMLKDRVDLLKTINELENQLEEHRKLQSEVHSDIEKVWMYDATLTKDLSAYQKRKRSEAIERVFYKIANQWI
jgi:hypothetical protein